jgi:2-polyprenyl-3-methyl-5-hydroxy-6-metoxy-1,4-benzoquinol methylase
VDCFNFSTPLSRHSLQLQRLINNLHYATSSVDSIMPYHSYMLLFLFLVLKRPSNFSLPSPLLSPSVIANTNCHYNLTTLTNYNHRETTMDKLMEDRIKRDMETPEHPFFHYYGMLIHQQNMLTDSVRTGIYRDAILKNKNDFKGKVVLDVGTGSGILAFFAVQAGAKKVYAVEASDVAEAAKALVEANNLSDKIIVIKGKVEEISIPEKVDVIISEPMGFMLVHERMLESFVAARDRFLSPKGLMMPSNGTIFVAPFSDQSLYDEQLAKVGFWSHHNFYGVVSLVVFSVSCIQPDTLSILYLCPLFLLLFSCSV